MSKRIRISVNLNNFEYMQNYIYFLEKYAQYIIYL